MRSKRGAISLQIFHSFLGARDLENWGVHPENDVCFRGSHKNARQRPRSPVEPMWRCQTPPTAGTQHGEGEVLVGVSNLSLDSANSIPHRGGGGRRRRPGVREVQVDGLPRQHGVGGQAPLGQPVPVFHQRRRGVRRMLAAAADPFSPSHGSVVLKVQGARVSLSLESHSF